MEVVTENEKKLAKLVYERNINKQDAIGICLYARKLQVVDIIVKWLEEHKIVDAESIFEFLIDLSKNED